MVAFTVVLFVPSLTVPLMVSSAPVVDGLNVTCDIAATALNSTIPDRQIILENKFSSVLMAASPADFELRTNGARLITIPRPHDSVAQPLRCATRRKET